MALDFILDVRVKETQGLRNHALGQAAETLVARHYQAKGYNLLAQRWRSARGEIDLILKAPSGELVFVEVKSSRSHQGAAFLLEPSQVGRITRASQEYLARFIGHLDVDMRFDLALVDQRACIEIVENAFFQSF